MSGTREGGLKVAEKNKANHGENFYQRIGAIGGKRGKTGGFAQAIPCDCNLIYGKHYVRQCAGLKGGVKSRRNKKGVTA